MYITFRNNSTDKKTVVLFESKEYVINPGEIVEVVCSGSDFEFETQMCVFDELKELVGEMESEQKTYSFKNRLLSKAVKKISDFISDIALDTCVKYGVNCADSQSTVIDLYEEAYSVCDGFVSDFIGLIPVCCLFARAEVRSGEIRVLDVKAKNIKQFLKLMRKALCCSFFNLIFFVPEYLIIRFCSSHFYIRRLFTVLYNKPEEKREKVLRKKEKRYEKEEGCLGAILKGFILLLIIGVLIAWTIVNQPT